jgi:serine/threonine protein kinase
MHTRPDTQSLGRPSPADMAAMQSPYAETTIARMHIKPGPPIESLLHGVCTIALSWPPSFPVVFCFCTMPFPAISSLQSPPDAVDLVRRMLTVNPQRRISALDALRHPYVAQFYAPRCVVRTAGTDTRAVKLMPRAVTTSIDDNTRLTIEDYRIHLYKVPPPPCLFCVTRPRVLPNAHSTDSDSG